MKTFFVTGGAGFIGSCFVRLLLNENPHCQVVNFDALTYAGNPDNLTGLDNDRHRFVCGDIADREAVLSNLDQNTDLSLTSLPSHMLTAASLPLTSFFARTSWARRFCWMPHARAA